MTLNEQEVYQLAFNRNLSDGIILKSQIYAAYESWIMGTLPGDFVAILEDNEDNAFDSFIEEYIKPVWAFGVLFDNFDHFTANIADKGIYYLVLEGTANVMSDNRLHSIRREYKQTIYNLLKRIDREAKKQEYEGYTGLLIDPQLMHYETGPAQLQKQAY